jgi:hypothetical protein
MLPDEPLGFGIDLMGDIKRPEGFNRFEHVLPDKSMPPVRMTRVMPIATIPTKEKLRVMFVIFCRSRNCGIKMARTRSISPSAPRIPASRGRRETRWGTAFSGWGGATASELIGSEGRLWRISPEIQTNLPEILTNQSDREIFALRRDPALDGKQLRWLRGMQQENSSMTNNLTWFCPKLDYP